MTAKKETYNFGLRDLDGRPVPDSRVSCVGRDIMRATGDYDTDSENGIYAYASNGNRVPLSKIGRGGVRFIAGAWRVQNVRGGLNVQVVRDKKFILGEILNIHEKNKFEYYRAAEYYENCYGVMEPVYSYVVAKYDTDNGPIWGYGTSVEQARAFLGIALFDANIRIIHAASRSKLDKQK